MGTVKPVPSAAKTKAGATVGGGPEAALLKEAEEGFDPTSLERRDAGRPSLSGRGGHSNRVDVRVDDQTYEAIRHYIEASEP
jgi:hypothetical protein